MCSHGPSKREVLHLTRRDIRRVPWKNGRGVTDEIALWPGDASFERGDFDWRVSRAAVDEAGPFSRFPGFDRILVVTDGEGLVLSHGDHARRARVRRLEPYLFSGDWPTRAELVAGAVADFNVIVHRERARASVEVCALERRRVLEALDEGHALVHVLAGEVVARVTGEEEAFALKPSDTVWVRGASEGVDAELTGASDGALALLVRIGRAR